MLPGGSICPQISVSVSRKQGIAQNQFPIPGDDVIDFFFHLFGGGGIDIPGEWYPEISARDSRKR